MIALLQKSCDSVGDLLDNPEVLAKRSEVAIGDELYAAGGEKITGLRGSQDPKLDFTRLALAAQDEGCDVIGYTSQAHFLVGCGILGLLEGQGIAATANAHKLLAEHEMGELFKVLAFARGCEFEPIGFAHGDRRHRL